MERAPDRSLLSQVFSDLKHELIWRGLDDGAESETGDVVLLDIGCYQRCVKQRCSPIYAWTSSTEVMASSASRAESSPMEVCRRLSEAGSGIVAGD